VRTKLALLVAALAFVAGCGGGGGGGDERLTKAEFEQRIQADGKAVQKAVSAISAGSSSLSELAKQVTAAEKAVQAAADDLSAVTPPADAEQPTSTIVSALRTIDVQLKNLAKAAKDNDPIAAQAAATAIQKAPEIAAAQKAANELKKKGYDIGVIGS
jgi:hypothetical protein